MLKALHEVMSDKMTVNITVIKKGEELVIMVGTKADVEDSSFDNIPPFTSSGRPEEAEQSLINAFKEPFKQLGATISGVAAFEEKQKEIDKENKAAKAVKDEKKAEKEKQDKDVVKLIEEGRKAVTEKKDISATQIVAKIKALLDGRKHTEFTTFEKEVDTLKSEMGTGTLFEQSKIEADDTSATSNESFQAERDNFERSGPGNVGEESS